MSDVDYMKKELIKDIVSNKYIYLLVLPAIIFYLIFAYGPMYGIQIAFKNFSASKGIWGSAWVGLENFMVMWQEPQFWRAFTNTVVISLGRLVTGFPVPILLAIMFNEMRDGKLKKGIQTITTFPNFLSWIVISGMIFNLLSSQGAINSIAEFFGLPAQNILSDKNMFQPLLYISAIWKSSGWGCIIYLAAISGINTELYEAAYIDGASRLQRIRYITWPGMQPTVVLLLILSLGGIMNAGFEQIFVMYNPTVYETADIIDTFVYRLTFVGAPDYGLGAAVGIFKSVINFLLLFVADRIAKLVDKDSGIF